MSAVVGFDFGNAYCKASIAVADEKYPDRITIYETGDVNFREGYPSICCFHKRKQELVVGASALNAPAKERVDLLKRKLNTDLDLDGHQYPVNGIISRIIQETYKVLFASLGSEDLKTNQVRISYPANFSASDLQIFVDIFNQTQLEDGRKLEVTGTICEPAAAGLDYFALHPSTKDVETVMVCDFGAGTSDIAVVSLYPKGYTDSRGNKRYYKVVRNQGIELAGNEFTEVMVTLLKEKIEDLGEDPESFNAARLRKCAEAMKAQLSTEDIAYDTLDQDIEVTREEFEKRCEKLCAKLVKLAQENFQHTLEENPGLTIDWIMLTGGSSKMPMIHKAFVKGFAKKVKEEQIIHHEPHLGVCHGTARFASDETQANTVEQFTSFDLGLIATRDHKKVFSVLIPKGESLPTKEFTKQYTIRNRTVVFDLRQMLVNDVEDEKNEQVCEWWPRFQGNLGESFDIVMKISMDEMNLLKIDVSVKDHPEITAHKEVKWIASKKKAADV